MVGIFLPKITTRTENITYRKIFLRKVESIIGHVKAGRVRIYKLNTFKALTDEENEIYNDKKKKKQIY